MEKYKDILLKSRLFKSITWEELGKLLNCLEAQAKKYRKGEYIVLEGDVVENAAIVLEGRAEIAKENLAGNKSILSFIEPGGLFGEVLACTEHKRSLVNVVACEETVILKINFNKIIESCSSSCVFHRQLIANMFKIIAEKNMALNIKMDYLLIKGMREKIAVFLLAKYKENKSLSFNIKFNRNEMADYLNVSRASMSRELSRMKEDGIIDYYKDSFKILDIDLLRKI